MGIIATSVSYFCWVASTVSMCSQLPDKMVNVLGRQVVPGKWVGFFHGDIYYVSNNPHLSAIDAPALSVSLSS